MRILPMLQILLTRIVAAKYYRTQYPSPLPGQGVRRKVFGYTGWALAVGKRSRKMRRH